MTMFSPLISYLPATRRPRLEWPNGARIALLVVPNVEHYEFVPPTNPLKVAYPGYPAAPDVVTYASRDYGNRVAFWRMLDTLDRSGLRITASLSLRVLELFPEIREAIVERDWCIVSHGLFNTRYLWGISESDEREFYRASIDIVRHYTGRRLRGMLGPAFTASTQTPRLMAEAGLDYTFDWFIDDQPFPINVPSGRLVGLPYTRETNDFFVRDPREFARACRDQFETLWAEGGSRPAVMTIALHPFVVSQPSRQVWLEEVLSFVGSQDGVWSTDADELATYYLSHYYDDAVTAAAQFAEDWPAAGPGASG
jgi:peptidoglycan/xylan/chitin deacetylase (PgdA/CDA1 family)